MDPQQQFFKALAALREGDLESCESICQRLLAINPREVNTLRLQAQVWHKRGELARAEAGFKAALSIANDFAHAWADLGKVQFSLEKNLLAEQSLRRALQLNSALKGASKLLAEVLEKQGKTTQSAVVKQVNQQHQILKEKVVEAYRLSTGATEDKGPERGETLCKEVLQADSEHVGAKEFLINRALETGRARWAEELSRSLVRKMPEQSKWWLKLSSALARQDQLVEAQEAVQQVLSIEPDLEEARMLLGSIFVRDNRFADALSQYDAVLQQNPNNIAALAQKGSALKTLGRQHESIQCLRRCMELDRSFGEAAWSLSNLKTYRFSDDEVVNIKAVLAVENLKDKDAVHFNYALGKAYEHRQQWDQAFAAYQTANRIKQQSAIWNADEFSAQVDQIIATFTPQLLQQHHNSGVDDSSPIFVLGLPRSGSTLQEQILSSHSQVEGTRELPYIPWIAQRLNRKPNPMCQDNYPLGAGQLEADQWRLLGTQFLAQAKRHRQTEAPFFIDKLPNNFLYVGLILLAMPNAKIINTVRNPMDNCFGCFKQLWAEGQNFTYDLEDLGRYYRDYHRLMAHWQAIFGDKIFSVNYEAVVANLETNVQELLDYCGLPMEEQCLRFHETERAVNTASSEQVRQPIYSSAVAYWRHFEEHLQPLKDALGDLAEA
ncbi:sulfotransferase [SAR92 clade bacterium H455]|uniref:Sulfotransferase n=1 Tax=SAR92 clade bacterium H455 TaxID=2974818 RepID=A0ABY5TQF8_9GAMM|nr:sulfotransferase [SAR92 clade bacterium H455]